MAINTKWQCSWCGDWWPGDPEANPFAVRAEEHGEEFVFCNDACYDVAKDEMELTNVRWPE